MRREILRTQAICRTRLDLRYSTASIQLLSGDRSAAIAEPLLVTGPGMTRVFPSGAPHATTVTIAYFTQLAMGRSSFGAPLLIHAHAITFMGWVVIYLTQNILVASGNVAPHRRSGWLAGCEVDGFAGLHGRRCSTPRRPRAVFLRPAGFVFDLTVISFYGLTYAAIAQVANGLAPAAALCAGGQMAWTGVRLVLPMPLLAPWAWEASFAACLVFPLAGVISDLRRGGRVHPAWLCGLGVTFAVLIGTESSSPTAPRVRCSTTPSPPAPRAPPSHR